MSDGEDSSSRGLQPVGTERFVGALGATEIIPTPTFEQIGRDLGTCGEKIAHVNEGVRDCSARAFALFSDLKDRVDNLLGSESAGPECLPGSDCPKAILDNAAYNVARLTEELDRLSDQINRL